MRRRRLLYIFFCQAEAGIRVLVRSRGLGDGYKRQGEARRRIEQTLDTLTTLERHQASGQFYNWYNPATCLLYTSDAADERSSVDLGGRRIIKKKKLIITSRTTTSQRKLIRAATMQTRD